jgi:metal-responsive CopG/Arc/MetJ family transcriptional regulator
MPRENKEIYNYQITSRIPKDLVNRVDKICSQKLQSRGGWIRQMIVEKVRELESSSPVFEKI